MTNVALDSPAAVVAELENKLKTSFTDLQARVLSLRILVSRLGEEDAWRRWNSRIWRAKIVFEPIFKSTWPRQRLTLTMNAARVDEAKRLGKQVDVACHLFHLNPEFDAALDHAFSLVGIDRCKTLNEIVDEFQWAGVVDLESLASLNPIQDSEHSEVAAAVNSIARALCNSSLESPWKNGAAL